jgi:tetratricopeptide (TPR) repeat protein
MDIEAEYSQAQALLEDGNFKEAARLFRELSQRIEDPLERGGMLTCELEALVHDGRFSEARDVVKDIEALGVADIFLIALVQRELAVIARAEKRVDDALRILDGLCTMRQALERDCPDSPFFRNLELERAYLLLEASRYSDALPLLVAADAQSPDPRNAYYIGYCLHGLGRYAEAVREYQRALDQNEVLPQKLLESVQQGIEDALSRSTPKSFRQQ